MSTNQNFEVHIISNTGILFEGQVESLGVNTTSGYITVLAHHIPLISVLSAGNITIKDEEGQKEFKIKSGIIDVGSQKTVALVTKDE